MKIENIKKSEKEDVSSGAPGPAHLGLLFSEGSYPLAEGEILGRPSGRGERPQRLWLADHGFNNEDTKGKINVHTFPQVLSFWEVISEILVEPDVEDKRTWYQEPKGSFSTKPIYKAHFGVMTISSTTSTIWKSW